MALYTFLFDFIRISLVTGSMSGAMVGGRRWEEKWGQFFFVFLFPGGRIIRAVILKREKFAEWLKASKRGSGKWPHLYSDKNYHLVKQDTREELDRPCVDVPSLSPRRPPPLHHLFTTSLFRKALCDSLSVDAFSRAMTTACAAFTEKAYTTSFHLPPLLNA